MRSKRLAGCQRSRRRAPCLSAGVTILIPIIKLLLDRARRRNRVSWLKLYEYSVWGSALPSALPIEEAFGGFRIGIVRHRAKKRPRHRRAPVQHRLITMIRQDSASPHRILRNSTCL